MNLNPAMWTVHARYRKSGVCSHTTISDKLGNGGSLNLVVVILSQTPCILCILTVEMLISSSHLNNVLPKTGIQLEDIPGW